MAGSVNKVLLVGRIGQDPKIRDLPNGGKVAGFSLATSERWKDKSGEVQERTEWTNISVFNERTVDVIQRFVKKGSLVHVEGSLSTRKYTDKDGQEKSATEVVISRFKGDLTLLDSAKDNGGDSGYQATPQQRALSQRPPQQKAMAYPEEGSGALLDDDIPFAPEWR